MNTKTVFIDPRSLLPETMVADPGGAEKARRLIKEAAKKLRAGRLVAFPTETVYGLGADARNEKAVRQIYEVKGRPQDNPLIIHIENAAQLGQLIDRSGDETSANYSAALIERFWPGPLTLIFRKNENLPGYATAGLDTVAVRMPSHPVAAALLKAAKTPIAAPSANLSGKPSPTRGDHAASDLDGKIDMIIDSGGVAIGLESTVLDVTRLPFEILRRGAVTYGMIVETIGAENVSAPTDDGDIRATRDALRDAPRSPGVKHRHYAPDAPMLMIKGGTPQIAYWIKKLYGAETALRDCANPATAGFARVGDPLTTIGIVASDELLAEADVRALRGTSHASLGSVRDPAAAANKFYDALRKLDAEDVRLIYGEFYHGAGLYAALADRMSRASGQYVLDAGAPLILFVCTGNTCRSAMAEAFFNDAIKKRANPVSVATAASAGVGAIPGASATYESIDVMKKYGVDLSGHKARSLDPELARRASLVLTMTSAHRDEVLRRFPELRLRAYTLAGFSLGLADDVDDPYGLGFAEYIKCAGLLRELVVPLAREL